MLNIKLKTENNLDLASLGEILLRFDPENERIHNARSFRVFDGGAEYNVARNWQKFSGVKRLSSPRWLTMLWAD